MKQSVIDSILESFAAGKMEVDQSLDELMTKVKTLYGEFVDYMKENLSNRCKDRFKSLLKALMYVFYGLFGISAIAIMIVLTPLLFIYSVGTISIRLLCDIFRYILSQFDLCIN